LNNLCKIFPVIIIAKSKQSRTFICVGIVNVNPVTQQKTDYAEETLMFVIGAGGDNCWISAAHPNALTQK
jgi:hypothetical protein